MLSNIFKSYYVERSELDLDSESLEKRYQQKISKTCYQLLESACVGSFEKPSDIIIYLDEIANCGLENCPIDVTNNKITEFTWVTSRFGSLNVGSPHIEKLFIYLDSEASIDFTEFPNLKTLVLFNKHFTLAPIGNLHNQVMPELKGLNHSSIESIYIEGFAIEELDLIKFTNVNSVSCPDNQISNLILPYSEKLQFLDCSENLIDELNVELYPNLNQLLLFGNPVNKIEEIDFSRNNKLELVVFPSSIVSFDKGDSSPLEWISVYGNLVIISKSQGCNMTYGAAVNMGIVSLALNKHNWISIESLEE